MADAIQIMLASGTLSLCEKQVIIDFANRFDAESFFDLLADGKTMDKFERERRAHRAAIAIRALAGDVEYWRIRGIISEALTGAEHTPAEGPRPGDKEPLDPAFRLGRELLIQKGEEAIEMIASGRFYEDHDASTEALGELRSLLDVVKDTIRD
jgi:hypothetical protein